MGPLPPLHKMVLVAALLLACLGTGVWLAGHFDLPLGGTGVGLGAGLLLAYVVTHDFDHRPPRSVRVRRR